MPLVFRPKVGKIIELLLYLAHKRPGADKYQAVKFLYLADREHLVRYGRPITQEEYFALPYGPVASTALDMLNGEAYPLKAVGLKELPFETAPKEPGSDIIVIGKPRRDVDLSSFSKSDLKVFDEILERYGKMDFGQLFTLTHNHEAYKLAWGRRGTRNSSPMYYEEMIDPPDLRARIVDDIEPVSKHM